MLPNAIDEFIARLVNSKFSKRIDLPPHELCEVVASAREQLLAEPCILQLAAPVNVVGDIHGQFSDLLRFLEFSGYPPDKQYLFLGDYVDRGRQSIETLTLLLALKIRYPSHVHLLRGNHESASVNMHYGFYDECKRRLTVKFWRDFVDCYNCLPVAALIDAKIFCCHGGLSPSLYELNDINDIKRPCDVPEEGVLCDLLWADPASDIFGWSSNERGVSFTFGADVVDGFLQRHSLDLVCRAHQVVEDGYEFFAKRQLVTIFSAPNYCGEFDNAGAMMCVDSALAISFVILKPSKQVVKLQRAKIKQ